MFSGIVLAGGKSKRMDEDKRRAALSGGTLLDLSVNRLKPIVEEVLVVLGEIEKFTSKDTRFVVDIIKGRGPIYGLLTGLTKMKNTYGLVTPVDTPLLTKELLLYLIENTRGYDAVIPRWERGVEPLVAVYSKGLLPHLKKWIDSEKPPSPQLFIQERGINIRWINEEEIRRFGDPETLFLNVNSRADLERAEKIMQGQGTV